MMSLPLVWRWRRGHALDVERRRGSFCRASVVLPVLLLLMRWRRGYRAGSFDDAAAGRGLCLLDVGRVGEMMRCSCRAPCPFIIFSISPCPLSPAPSCLLALNNPPPPGVGGADGRAICDCVRGAGLLASHHVVPLSRSSLVRYCRPNAMMSSPPPRHGHDVIGRLVIEPIPPRRIITPRCLPSPLPLSHPMPHRSPPCLLRSRHRPIARCYRRRPIRPPA